MVYSKRNKLLFGKNRSCKVGGGMINHSIKFTYLERDYILSKKSLWRGYLFNENSFSNLNALIDYFKQNNSDTKLYIELFNILMTKYSNKTIKFHFIKLLLRCNEWVDISMNPNIEIYINDIIQNIEYIPYSIQLLDTLSSFFTLLNMEYLYTKYTMSDKNMNIFDNTKIYKNIRIYKKLLQLYTFIEIPNSIDKSFAENIPLLLNHIYGLLPICKIEPRLTNIVTNQSKFIESGSFGSVFKNETKSQAIKVIDTSKYESLTSIIHLIYREVYTYYRISALACNRNLFCNFINAYYDDNKHKIYVLMEYCGTDLFTVLDSGTIRQIPIKWFLNIARGIKCMHDNNYVHFDIKPENIVIENVVEQRPKKRISKHWIFDSKRSSSGSRSSSSGSRSSSSGSRRSRRSGSNRGSLLIPPQTNAKLIDFGLSYEISSISSKISPGTNGYRAPELGIQIGIDYKKCDIYSFGMTIGLCLYFTKYLPNNSVSTDDILIGRKFKDLYKLLSILKLQNMVDNNPDMRPDIDTVITLLQQKTFLY